MSIKKDKLNTKYPRLKLKLRIRREKAQIIEIKKIR